MRTRDSPRITLYRRRVQSNEPNALAPRSRATTLLIALILASSSLAGCSAGGHVAVPPRPHEPVPRPNLSAFVPRNFRMTRVQAVNLDGSGEPELAVTAVANTSHAGVAPSTVLLLAWNSTAKRWTTPFNASTQSSYQVVLQRRGGAAAGLNYLDQVPRLAVVHDQANGAADLVYWMKWVTRTSSVFLVGILHYANDRADLAWTFTTDETRGLLNGNPEVTVEGSAPLQQIAVALPLASQSDPSKAIRPYHLVIARVQQGSGDMYEVLSQDRPFVGVGLAPLANSARGTVTYVPAASPARETLRLGDIIDGIDGISPTHRAHGVPAVIDEVARRHPGDIVALDVERAGHPIRLNFKLNQWNFPLWQSGYSGVAAGAIGVYVQLHGASVVVNASVPGGPADTAGIVAGSVLTAVNGIPIHAIANLAAAFSNVVAGGTATISYTTPNGLQVTTSVGLGLPSETSLQPLFTL